MLRFVFPVCRRTQGPRTRPDELHAVGRRCALLVSPQSKPCLSAPFSTKDGREKSQSVTGVFTELQYCKPGTGAQWHICGFE